MDDNWNQKFKILTFALVASGALNIGLIVTVATMSMSDEGSASLAASKKGVEVQKLTNGAILQSMAKLSFRELATLLTNQEMVEEGYAKRDLAVAALVSFHHFNLDKALGSPVTQKRWLSVEGREPIEVFAGLTEEQFDAIVRFAYQEKWPLTSKGLFVLLQKGEFSQDESLKEAFALTPEFYALQTLFQKSGAPQEVKTLLNLVVEGNWDLLDRFAKEQAQLLDLSPEKRKRLLLSYLAHRSSTSAQLLLQTDGAFALKKLDDQGVLDLVTLLQQKTDPASQFCASLLSSPRSDAVLQAAALKLYAFAGEPTPAPLDVKAAAARFATVQQKPAAVAKAAPAAPKAGGQGKSHTVKDGESLWKISKQYKVKVDDIVKMNGLEKQTIRPGMVLKIPV